MCDPEVRDDCFIPEDQYPYLDLGPTFMIGAVSLVGFVWPFIIQFWENASTEVTFFTANGGLIWENYYYCSTTWTMLLFWSIYGIQFGLFLLSLISIDGQYVFLVCAKIVDSLFGAAYFPSMLAIFSYFISKEYKFSGMHMGTFFIQLGLVMSMTFFQHFGFVEMEKIYWTRYYGQLDEINAVIEEQEAQEIAENTEMQIPDELYLEF